MEDVSLSAAARSPRLIVRNAPAIGLLLCVAAMAVLIVRARFGAPNEDMAGVVIVFLIAYIVALGEAIRTQRQWWTLATLPVALLLAVDLFAF